MNDFYVYNFIIYEPLRVSKRLVFGELLKFFTSCTRWIVCVFHRDLVIADVYLGRTK